MVHELSAAALLISDTQRGLPAGRCRSARSKMVTLTLCASYKELSRSSDGSLAPQITPSSPPMKAATPSGACSQNHPGYSCGQ
jgi:hypothetical protein